MDQDNSTTPDYYTSYSCDSQGKTIVCLSIHGRFFALVFYSKHVTDETDKKDRHYTLFGTVEQRNENTYLLYTSKFQPFGSRKHRTDKHGFETILLFEFIDLGVDLVNFDWRATMSSTASNPTFNALLIPDRHLRCSPRFFDLDTFKTTYKMLKTDAQESIEFNIASFAIDPIDCPSQERNAGDDELDQCKACT